MIQNMDNSFLSQFVNGMTGSETLSQSKLYSSWSVCGDEPVTSSVPEFREKSSQFTFTDSGNRLDMFGLVSSNTEESNKVEPVTDWDSLSKLFPPLWTPNTDEQRELSDYLPHTVPDSDTQSYRKEIRTLPDMGSLQRGFEDLGLLESFVSHPEPQLDELSNDVYIENPALKLNSTFHQTQQPPQYTGDYIKFNCTDYAMNGASVGTNAQKRPHEYSGFPKQVWKGENGSFTFGKSSPTNPLIYSSDSRDAWSKENYLKTCNVEPPSMKPTIPQYNQQFHKERRFLPFAQRKLYNTGSENQYTNYPNIPFDSHENQVCQGPNESFMKSSDFSSSTNAIYHNENLQPSCFGNRFLDFEAVGTQKQAISPLPSPVSSLSDGSPTHNSLSQQPYYSHAASSSSSLSDGHTHRNSATNKMTFSGLIDENQRGVKSFGQSSPTKEGNYGKMSFGFQAPKSPTPQNSDRYQRLSKKNNPQNNSNTDKRCKRNWSAQQGNARSNPQQFNMFQKKQDANIGNVSDFINASFLPSFSLMSNLKQNQHFPSFNAQPFAPSANMPFPPPPFPFSDLIDLLHYEDLNPLNPFINELLSGEIPPPYVAFPAPFNRYRPPRNRSGPASELHSQLEECCEQLRVLEKDRKKTEADLARHFPGNRVSSSYNSSVPRLPTNPSRVDRLIVDELREQARAVSLVKIMERICSCSLHVNITLALEHHLEAILLTQARRKDEIVNVANRQKQGSPRFNNERDVLALAAAIKEMVASTRKARTALWCALQMTLAKSPSGSAVAPEDLERVLQELCPRQSSSSTDVEDGKKGCEEKHL
ncbi:Hypothetical predicted protein [Pelobates cultripes]|uniref:Meiosis-specific coiled-coil domain-containing protein MEIOC n=2 Tax=Pelobates cultripes TaxID=61616 RepID=A0AAD1W3E8_PELCU|nr:Hypothetical predicted protein [Pelobates cultripes]